MRDESRKNGDAKALSRRNFLKKAVVGGVAAAAMSVAPAFVRNARSSSGSLVLYSWSDYIYQDMIDAFTKKTGIKVTMATYGSNDEVLNKLRAAKGAGFDIVMPSVTYGEQWYKNGDLLLPLDESKNPCGRLLPGHVGILQEARWRASPQTLPGPLQLGHRGHHL